jgi:hypothetical protein
MERTMACDACGKIGVPLEPLREMYATETVMHVCDGCSKVINEQLWKVQAATIKIQKGLIRRFIDNLREKFAKKGENDGR